MIGGGKPVQPAHNIKEGVTETARLYFVGPVVEGIYMLLIIALILGILWALGFFAVQIGGGLIHILLVIALVVFIYNMIAGRRSV